MVICTSAIMANANHEEEIATGVGWSYISSGDISANGPAVDIYGSSIFKNNAVLFCWLDFIFPLEATVDAGIAKVSIDRDMFDSLWGMECLFGGGYRFKLSENVQLTTGGGLYWADVNSDIYDVSSSDSGLGIGAMGRLRYKFNSGFFLDTGLRVTVNFFYYSNSTSEFEAGTSVYGKVGFGYAF